jgi:hypothetical protein
MTLPDRLLARHLVIVVVLKLLVLAGLWWWFVRDSHVRVDADNAAARLVAPADGSTAFKGALK